MPSHYSWRQRCSGRQRWLHPLIVLLLLCSGFTQHLHAQSEQPTPTPTATLTPTPADTTPTMAEVEDRYLNDQVDQILQQMSPADKVGQLFIITFSGNDTDPQSDIAELIHTYRVGGVVLTPRYNNFSNAKGTDTVRQVTMLTNQLQGLAYGVALPPDKVFTSLAEQIAQSEPLANSTSLTQTAPPPVYLPLFIAVEQAGDDLPLTALRNGFTPLPSQMALGATWDPELTRQIGEIVGRELHAVGINLLLGPNLDVIDNPRADAIGSLGIHSFGGDPYWVGKLGQHYITGVHQGGRGHVATMARHFPGQGDVDRLPDQEVATVQKSLEELQQVSLAPFRDVTQATSLILRSDGDPGATDGMMTSHMRYTNLPGGGAKPISIETNMRTVLEQEGFTDWRTHGGVLMSDAIGVRAIRRHYDATEQSFELRQVALDIFRAGHDLIYLDEIGPINNGINGQDSWPATKAGVIEIIQSFQNRYTTASDPGFARDVDAAVRRILRLKLRLFGQTFLPDATTNVSGVISATLPSTPPLTSTLTFTMPVIPLTEVLTPAERPQVLLTDNLELARTTVSEVASRSFAVLKPNAQTLAEVLPEAPQTDENILIFTDSPLLYECQPGCTAEAVLGPTAIADIIVQLYGEQSTGQISRKQIKSKTLGELAQWLGPIQTAPNATETITTTVPGPSTSLAITTEQALMLEGVDKALNQSQSNIVASTVLTKEIEEAEWIIIAMLDIDPKRPSLISSIDVVKNFLNGSRSEQLQDKKIIIWAMSAPYFLDATEISRVTAYFGVFSKTPPFVESAVSALFRGYPPSGAPPVNVPGTGFATLAERLKPDPNRTLPLQIFPGNSSTPLVFDGGNQPQVQVGERVRLVVGPLLDLNGKPVPDGTPINFMLTYEGETSVLNIEPGATNEGKVIRDVPLERAGKLQITVASGEVHSDGQAILLVQDPAQPAPTSPVPTATPQMAPTVVTPSITSSVPVTTSGPISSGQSTSAGQNESDNDRPVNLITLAVALLTILITLSLLLIAQIQILPRQILVHNMLWATIFGLGAYILYGIGLLPGIAMLQESLNAFGPALVVFIAMLLPLLWLQLRTEQGQ